MKREHPRPNYKEEKYSEYDEDTGLWCVFGLESGHAYSSHTSYEMAELSRLRDYPENDVKKMKTEAEIREALKTLSKWVCTNQHERDNRRKLQDALRWVLGEVTIPALDSNSVKAGA